MILYNVTVKITTDVHQEWVHWMKNTHIPDVLATGLFTGYKMFRIMGDEDPEGVTYAIQYFSPSLEAFLRYRDEHAPRLQAEHAQRYANKYVAFRTLMEEI